MMVSNVCLYFPSKVSNCACEVGTSHRMGLHQHPFFRRKSTGLSQKRCKVFVDFTNVMEEGSGPNLIDLLGIQTKLARDLTGVFRNTHRMARRVGVSCFNSLYHQLEKLSVDTFYLKGHLTHVTNKEQREDKHHQSY